MAPRRRSGFGKKIDTTRWTAVSTGQNALAAGSAGLNILAAGAPSETILRTRGSGIAYIDGASAPGKLVLLTMGLIVVPEGTGVGTIWDPFNDDNAPWFWWQEVTLGYEEMVTDVIDVPGLTSFRFDIDSKAMRKANEDEEVSLVIVNTTILTAAAVNVRLNFRFLLGH